MHVAEGIGVALAIERIRQTLKLALLYDFLNLKTCILPRPIPPPNHSGPSGATAGKPGPRVFSTQATSSEQNTAERSSSLLWWAMDCSRLSSRFSYRLPWAARSMSGSAGKLDT